MAEDSIKISQLCRHGMASGRTKKIIYTSVADIGLTVGSATIAGAWSAMQDGCSLIANATDFASGQAPSTSGVVNIAKISSTNGWIEFHGKESTNNDYRMFLDTNGSPTGTWEDTFTAVEDIVVLTNQGTQRFSLNAGATAHVINAGYVTAPTPPEGYELLLAMYYTNQPDVVNSVCGMAYICNTSTATRTNLLAYCRAVFVKKRGG